MATQVKFSTRGFDEYLAEIALAGRDVEESAARAVLVAAEVAQEGMQNRVPKDSWNLHKHIQIKGPEKDGNYIFVEVGVIHEIAFTDADTARYGNAQEYGTANMAPQPYIRPTMINDARKMRQAMRESLIEDGTI